MANSENETSSTEGATGSATENATENSTGSSTESATESPMATYNDRALHEARDKTLPKPQIEIIVDGNTVFKPGMKTFFIEDEDAHNVKVMGEYCSCDTVCTCNSVCTCESVCTCQTVCGCVAYTASPVNPGGGTGTTCTCQSVSCGSPCACVPVH